MKPFLEEPTPFVAEEGIKVVNSKTGEEVILTKEQIDEACVEYVRKKKLLK